MRHWENIMKDNFHVKQVKVIFLYIEVYFFFPISLQNKFFIGQGRSYVVLLSRKMIVRLIQTKFERCEI